jgi:hypothetical protein
MVLRNCENHLRQLPFTSTFASPPPPPSSSSIDIPVSMTRQSAPVFSLVRVLFLKSEYFQIGLERRATVKFGN